MCECVCMPKNICVFMMQVAGSSSKFRIYAKLEENDKTRQKWLESRLESSTPRTKKCYKIEIFCVFRDVFRFNWCFRGVCDGFSRLLFSYARDQVSVLLPRSVLCHMPATRGYFEVNNNELSNSKFSCK